MQDGTRDGADRWHWRAFGLCLLVLLACFSSLLGKLVHLTLQSQLYSYIPLVPLITLYLLQQRRQRLAVSAPAYGWAAAFGALGLALLAAGFRLPAGAEEQDRVAFGMAALLAFVMTAVALCFGRALLRTGLYPWCNLLFAIPLPAAWEASLEHILQHASAAAAAGLFALTPMPVFRDGMVFNLPNLSLAVAPECSGIHSTWVLFMCSFIAGALFLRTTWRRAVLAAFVFPLGVVRNGFRILTLGLLTVYVDPRIIDGPLHHKGGPIFFALSLIVLLALLVGFWRSEQQSAGALHAGRSKS